MKLTNYRNKHILIIIMTIQFVVGEIIEPNGIAAMLMFVLFAVLIGLFLGSGKFEKQDEWTKDNVRRSNSIALAVLLIALVIMGIIGGNLNHNGHSTKFLAEDAYWYIAAGAIILRSVTFLILDRPLKNSREDE